VDRAERSAPPRGHCLFDQDIVSWVYESRPFSAVAEEETPAGMLLTLRVRDEHDLLPWFLGWGSHVQVLSPESLRSLLRDEIARMAQIY